MQAPNPHLVHFFFKKIKFPSFFSIYATQTGLLHNINHNNQYGGSIMSDLTASNCGCTNNDNNCCSSLIWIIILLSICGNGNGRSGNDCGCGCGSGFGFFGGNNNGCGCEIIIILLLLCCCGGNSFC